MDQTAAHENGASALQHTEQHARDAQAAAPPPGPEKEMQSAANAAALPASSGGTHAAASHPASATAPPAAEPPHATDGPPDTATASAPVTAPLGAQRQVDPHADPDAGESQALLQRHGDFAVGRGSDCSHVGSGSLRSVSLPDSDAISDVYSDDLTARQLPGESHGARRVSLAGQPPLETPSARGHQLLMAGLAALPLEARRLLPESILALLQCRERQDSHVSPTFEDSALPGGAKVDEAGVLRKVNRHLLTRFLMLTMLCYLDRTNLAFAALQLNRDLGFSEYVYGLGSSIFFITYALAQVPSNMVLVRVGGPLWLGIIVTVWGIVATAFVGLSSTAGFYALRLLLGLAEAGTFPGLWYMLTQFYTTPEVAVAYAICQAGSVISQVFGAPLAAALLAMDGFLGLDGWQWLFLAEGLPTVAFGVWLRCTLAHAPATAAFLQPAERLWLARRNEAHKAMGGSLAEVEWEGILHWKTWALAALDCCISTTKYALLYFTPLIIYTIVGLQNERAHAALHPEGGAAAPARGGGDFDDFGSGGDAPSEVLVALLTAVPFAVAAFSTVANAWHSKRCAERRWHVVVPLLTSAAAMVALAMTMGSHAGLAFCALLLTTLAWAPGGILSAYPSSYLSGPAAASGWAVVNAVGALLGGLAGPFLVGALKHKSGDYTAATLVLAAVMTVGAVFAFFVLPVISPDSSMRAAALEGAAPPRKQQGDAAALSASDARMQQLQLMPLTSSQC